MAKEFGRQFRVCFTLDRNLEDGFKEKVKKQFDSLLKMGVLSIKVSNQLIFSVASFPDENIYQKNNESDNHNKCCHIKNEKNLHEIDFKSQNILNSKILEKIEFKDINNNIHSSESFKLSNNISLTSIDSSASVHNRFYESQEENKIKKTFQTYDIEKDICISSQDEALNKPNLSDYEENKEIGFLFGKSEVSSINDIKNYKDEKQILRTSKNDRKDIREEACSKDCHKKVLTKNYKINDVVSPINQTSVPYVEQLPESQQEVLKTNNQTLPKVHFSPTQQCCDQNPFAKEENVINKIDSKKSRQNTKINLSSLKNQNSPHLNSLHHQQHQPYMLPVLYKYNNKTNFEYNAPPLKHSNMLPYNIPNHYEKKYHSSHIHPYLNHHYQRSNHPFFSQNLSPHYLQHINPSFFHDRSYNESNVYFKEKKRNVLQQHSLQTMMMGCNSEIPNDYIYKGGSLNHQHKTNSNFHFNGHPFPHENKICFRKHEQQSFPTNIVDPYKSLYNNSINSFEVEKKQFDILKVSNSEKSLYKNSTSILNQKNINSLIPNEESVDNTEYSLSQKKSLSNNKKYKKTSLERQASHLNMKQSHAAQCEDTAHSPGEPLVFKPPSLDCLKHLLIEEDLDNCLHDLDNLLDLDIDEALKIGEQEAEGKDSENLHGERKGHKMKCNKPNSEDQNLQTFNSNSKHHNTSHFNKKPKNELLEQNNLHTQNVIGVSSLPEQNYPKVQSNYTHQINKDISCLQTAKSTLNINNKNMNTFCKDDSSYHMKYNNDNASNNSLQNNVTNQKIKDSKCNISNYNEEKKSILNNCVYRKNENFKQKKRDTNKVKTNIDSNKRIKSRIKKDDDDNDNETFTEKKKRKRIKHYSEEGKDANDVDCKQEKVMEVLHCQMSHSNKLDDGSEKSSKTKNKTTGFMADDEIKQPVNFSSPSSFLLSSPSTSSISSSFSPSSFSSSSSGIFLSPQNKNIPVCHENIEITDVNKYDKNFDYINNKKSHTYTNENKNNLELIDVSLSSKPTC